MAVWLSFDRLSSHFVQVKRQAQEAAPRQQSGSVFRSLLGLDEDKVPQFSGSELHTDAMQLQYCLNTASCVHSMFRVVYTALGFRLQAVACVNYDSIKC